MNKVLVVDDEEQIVGILDDFFSEKGYDTDVAYTLEGAQEKLVDFKPDVILLDINLPDGDGVEFLHDIMPEHEDTKVIMITGLEDKEIALKALEYGAVDYITKPLDLEYIETSILSNIIG